MAAKKPTTLTSTINESDLEYHEALGNGASGEVYRVTWKSKKLGNVNAAAKRILLIKGNGEQIETEISFLQKLKHPNLIEYYGHVVTTTHVVIVLEYAAKGSLYDYLEEKSCLPTDLKRKWAIQAARGIKYLTESSVVHRDIKSPNLLITGENTLKICDFGSSKDLTSTKTTKSEKGSIRWQAPEVFTENKLSLKADIFAFGVVLWELDTCEKPYKGKTDNQVMYKVGNYDLRPKISANCPLILKNLMQQCWHKDRNERPDFDDVISQLESMDLRMPRENGEEIEANCTDVTIPTGRQLLNTTMAVAETQVTLDKVPSNFNWILEDVQIAKKIKLESRMRQGRNALQNKKNAEARRIFLEILDLGSVDCCDDLYTTLQSCSTYERGQWEFRADCAKLAYTHSDYYLKHPEEMTERLSEIDLNQHSSNEKVTIASFSERVESLMDLGHSKFGRLRNKHFQMEQTMLKQATVRGENNATLDAVAEVLAEIRCMLDHTMAAFKEIHYPESKPRSNPYYFVPAELAPKTEEEVKTTLLRQFEKEYNWTEPVLFSVKFPDLLDFLVKIQPAYHPKNNWIRAVVKRNNMAKHDAAYDFLPKLYVEETICPSTSKQPRVKASTDGSCSENKTQKKGKKEEASLTSSDGAGIGSDTIYMLYWVRDLARKATTEVEYIVAEFYKYI